MKAKKAKPGHMFTWIIAKKDGTSEVTPTVVLKVPCTLCGAIALTKLPPTLAAEQSDGTTHVCNPMFKGCNHGFELSPGYAALLELTSN